MYAKSPFNLSIGRVDEKYERWKTVRKQAMQNKNQEFDRLLEDIKKREKTREKSYNKFMKTENDKRNKNFQKWSERRYHAKQEYERAMRNKEDDSYYRYVTQLFISVVTAKKLRR